MMRRILFIILFSIFLDSLVSAQTMELKNFKSRSEPKGFREMEWGQDVSPLLLKDMVYIDSDPTIDAIKIYEKKKDNLKFGKVECDKIQYGLFNNKFYFVAIRVKSEDKLRQLKDELSEKFGEPVNFFDVSYLLNGDITSIILSNRIESNGLGTLLMRSAKVEQEIQDWQVEQKPTSGVAIDIFINAAEHNNIEKVKQYLDKGMDVNLQNEDGRTALIMAGFHGSLETAKLLLEKGANVNIKDTVGWTALDAAVSEGNFDMAKLLIENGADVNTKQTDGYTVLMLASYNSHFDIVKLLIENGADVNAKDEKGNTALLMAAKGNSPEIFKLLIEKGADINVKDNNGWTPLMMAARFNAFKVAELLIEKGADINAVNKDGKTALGIAQWVGYAEMIKLLNKYGAK